MLFGPSDRTCVCFLACFFCNTWWLKKKKNEDMISIAARVRHVFLLALVINNLLLFNTAVAADDDNTVSREEKKAFEALARAVRSEPGGHVDPSLGLLKPAPSGAPRGIGVVKDPKKNSRKDDDDVVIKVPYSYQMTRHLALSTLTPLVPKEVLRELPLLELDDAALLVLLLLHEYGLGKKSRFLAYVNSLPRHDDDGGGCGWAQSGEDFRNLPPGVDAYDIDAAVHYSNRVATGLSEDYGRYLSKDRWPGCWKENNKRAFLWSLCIVSSRGTAANLYPGDATKSGVRLVPLADMANHQVVSGGFTELSGTERISNGDFVDALPEDAGSFVVRSAWKCGTTKELFEGDEILVNYNLPDFAAVDWYLSLGFVPKELSKPHRSEL